MSQVDQKDNFQALAVGVIATSILIFLFGLALNYFLDQSFTITVVLLFLIPLIAQIFGLWQLHKLCRTDPTDKGKRVFFNFYLVIMIVCVFTYGLWGAYAYLNNPASFKITKQSLERLKAESVPEDILEKLNSLEDQRFTREEEFLGKLKTTIGEEQTVKFKSLILKHANARYLLQFLSCTALLFISILVGLVVRLTWVIIKGAPDDQDRIQNIKWWNLWNFECLRIGASQEKTLAFAFVLFFTGFLSVSYLFAFAFAFHDKAKTLSGRQALFMRNLVPDKTASNSNNPSHEFGFEASFKITEQSLGGLKTENVPNDILEKLNNLKDREVTGQEKFLGMLKTAIGDEQTVKFKSLILKHADFEFEFKFAVGRANPDIDDLSEGDLLDLAADRKETAKMRIRNRDILKEVIKNIKDLSSDYKRIRMIVVGSADGKRIAEKSYQSNYELGKSYQSNYELGEARAERVKHAIVEQLAKDNNNQWYNIEWICFSSSNEDEFKSLKDNSPNNNPACRIVKVKIEPSPNDPAALQLKQLQENDNILQYKPLSLIDYIYFSNYTITTTGYGDIVPDTAYAKFLCALANICEVIFLVIFINALLSLRKSQEPKQ